jgi:hypothetical protein
MADRNVRVIRNNGKKPIIKSFLKTASEALDKNSLVELTSGTLGAVDDGELTVLGVVIEECATTDTDYTLSTKKQVELIQPGDEVEITTNGTLTVGAAYGLSNAYTVDSADTTADTFTCTKSISSTRAIGFLRTVAGKGDIAA